MSFKVLHGSRALLRYRSPVSTRKGTTQGLWGSGVGLRHPRDQERGQNEVCGPAGVCYGASVDQRFRKSW